MMVCMELLEIFLHQGCLSESAALALGREVLTAYPDLAVRICTFPEMRDRAEELGITVMPAFVLNGKIIAVGVPRKEWLVAKLQEFGITAGGLPP